MQRTDLLAQYIAYHKPGWVVYWPVKQTVACVDSCTQQLARLLDIGRQGQVQLAVLVSRSFVENMMEVVPLDYEQSIEIVTSVEQLVKTVADDQGK